MSALLARWAEKLAGGPQVGRWDSPLAKVTGVGRQQQQCDVVYLFSSCALYSAWSGVKRVHVVLSGLRMKLFV